jgi:uncharacterized membrane protein YdbT with pleckstrin-like domain
MIIRPSYVPFVSKGTAIIVAAIIAYGFVTTNSLAQWGVLSDNGLGYLASYALFGLMAIGFLSLTVGFFRRNAYTYMITETDIIVRRQLLTRNIRRIPLASISDVQISQSMLGRLAGYGDIVPISKSGYGILRDVDYQSETVVTEMTDVPNPDHVADYIMSKIEQTPQTG